MTVDITLTVLGCGSSSGSPVVGCDCATCVSRNPKNCRSRCSAYVQIGEQGWLIDTGTDFRWQALREQLPRIDGVLYTHPHADHLNGIDDLRAFCYRQKGAIAIYGNKHTIANIQQRFDYAFFPVGHHWNRPVLQAHVVETSDQYPVFHINQVPIWHFAVPHGRWTCSAFRIGNLAWFTDLNDISDEVVACLAGVDYLFLDCLMERAYTSHLCREQAFAFAERIAAKHTYFIHMTHALEYESLLAQCPPNAAPAYDGLQVRSRYCIPAAA
ncbi:MBL fold metallo-hydrolase [Stenoxybacter acetivorans]|uniref:MBL fold metallo-hydrolase n=1 Tax=Stenoxybacter acetivorans TaxID=422441 RepID=UPI00056780BB|nr:MBL fold metallo-hydrolase [Stenoxybacter acetivorans]